MPLFSFHVRYLAHKSANEHFCDVVNTESLSLVQFYAIDLLMINIVDNIYYTSSARLSAYVLRLTIQSKFEF